MNCPACQTAMSVVDYMHKEEAWALVGMKGWRCSVCGYGVNPLGEVNRRFLSLTLGLVEPPQLPTTEHWQTESHSLEIPHLDHGSGALRW
jgi:C4-type Zn-finger protein